MPNALSLDENAHFVRWDVSGGSYNEDTDTLTFEDGVDAYTLTAVYESNEEVDADLVDNANTYNSASEMTVLQLYLLTRMKYNTINSTS